MTRRALGFLVLVISFATIEARPVIVEFRGAGHLARFRQDLAGTRIAANGVTAAPRIRFQYATVFHGAAIEASEDEIARLRTLPYVHAIHADRVVWASGLPSGGRATRGRPEAHTTPIGDARGRVNAATLPTRGDGIVVAIVDTGIDYTHPALGGGFGPGRKVAGGYDFFNDDADPIDDNGHGTHVAGIVAAESAQLTGVAPGATLYAYKVLDADGFGTVSSVIAGIERCADPNGDGDTTDRVDVANVSLGAPGHPGDAMSRAIDNATAAGVVFAVAAGNAGGIKTVLSPGAARTAITVGAEWMGAMATFSGGGPTFGSLAFKPDVVAPGFGILSTWLAGGLLVSDGTSMAAPHVAGIAALLRKLHPGWTPAEVKAAIVSGTVEVPDMPFRRGAGSVDALRAHTANVFASESGLSFGLASDATGTFEATRSVVFSNRGTSDETFTAAAWSAPAGMTLTVTPTTFALPAGGSQTVVVTLRIDNAAMPFTVKPARGDSIRFTGSNGTILGIGWGVLRAARLTVRYAGGELMSALAYGDGDPVLAELYDDDLAEALFVPGAKWDVLVSAVDGTHRLIAFEQREIGGDVLLDADAADAPLPVVLDARDERGLPLRLLPRSDGRQVHDATMRVIHAKGSSLPYALGTSELRLSPMTRFRLIPFESYVDLDARRVYTVQHETLTSLTEEPKTLTRDAASYLRGSVTWRRTTDDEQTLTICGLTAFKPDYLYFGTGLNCLDAALGEELTVEYFTTEEKNAEGSGAMVMSSDRVALPLVRAREGELVISSETVPKPTALRIADGGGATVGIGPRHPWAFFGTNLHLTNGNYLGFGYPAWGYIGAAGEIRHEVEAGTYWWLFDAAGNGVKYGHLADTWLQRLRVEPGYRFVARNDTFRVAGHPSRSELEMRYGSSESDRTPPTITSLRILDASGRSIERVANGEAAALHLAFADLHEAGVGNPRTLPLRPEKTRVWYRVAGALDWTPLGSPVFERSESGSAAILGHMPTGETYRVDLAPATKHANTLIDLRIDIEDGAGNQTTWIQSPVMMVGEVVSAPKRRSAR